MKKNSIGVLLSFLLIFMGCSLIMIGLLNNYNHNSLMSTYSVTTGVHEGFNKEDNNVHFYKYTVNGVDYQIKADYYIRTNKTLEGINYNVNIFYDKNNPSVATIDSIGNVPFVVLSGICLVLFGVAYLIKASKPKTIKEQVSRTRAVLFLFGLGAILFCIGFITYLCADYPSYSFIFLDTLRLFWSLLFITVIGIIICLWIIEVNKSKKESYNMFE